MKNDSNKSEIKTMKHSAYVSNQDCELICNTKKVIFGDKHVSSQVHEAMIRQIASDVGIGKNLLYVTGKINIQDVEIVIPQCTSLLDILLLPDTIDKLITLEKIKNLPDKVLGAGMVSSFESRPKILGTSHISGVHSKDDRVMSMSIKTPSGMMDDHVRNEFLALVYSSDPSNAYKRFNKRLLSEVYMAAFEKIVGVVENMISDKLYAIRDSNMDNIHFGLFLVKNLSIFENASIDSIETVLENEVEKLDKYIYIYIIAEAKNLARIIEEKMDRKNG